MGYHLVRGLITLVIFVLIWSAIYLTDQFIRANFSGTPYIIASALFAGILLAIFVGKR